MMKKGVNGSANSAMAMPQISSTTTCLGSFCASTFSAAWAIHVENMINAATKIDAGPIRMDEINRHMGKAAREPKVPGATGEKPIKPPVAINIIAFCLNVSMGSNHSFKTRPVIQKQPTQPIKPNKLIKRSFPYLPQFPLFLTSPLLALDS